MARGVAWTSAARFAVRGLGFISTLVLARLLVPHDFGLVAMATSLIALLELASAFNFDVALIQNRQATREDYDTAWTLNLLLNSAVALLLAVAAPFAAAFYGEPALTPVIWILAGSLLVQGLENIGTVDFRRNLDFRRDFKLMVVRKLFGFCVTIPLAFVLRSYWALIAGMVASAMAGVVLSYAMHPFRPRLRLAGAGRLFGFSGWMVINNFLFFLRGRAPDFIIGRIGGPNGLGLFSVASDIANLPTTELVAPINRAVMPAYVQLAEDESRLREGFATVLGFIAIVALPVSIGMAVVALPAVQVLLGDKWLPAAPLIGWLAIAGGMNALQTNGGAVGVAVGRPWLNTVNQTVQATTLLPMIFFGAAWSGVEGAAMAIALHGVCIGIPTAFATLVIGTPVRLADVGAALWRPVAASAVMYAGVGYLLERIQAPPAAELIAGVALGVALYVATISALWVAAGAPGGPEAFVVKRARTWLAREGVPG